MCKKSEQREQSPKALFKIFKYYLERRLYLGGPPSLVSLVILQPDDHGAVDRLDGNFSLWQGVLEPVPIVVLQGRYNNLINAI